MKELDDVLIHYGVKGMKWGVIRWRKNSNKSALSERIGQELDSMKRERLWKKSIRNVDNMSTKEINAIAKRARLENDLKRLSKSKIASAKDKNDYRIRADMSDQELTRKVNRLNAKDTLQKQYDAATQRQRDIGMRIVNTGSSLAIKYVINKKKLSSDDVWDSLVNPKGAQQQAMKKLMETSFKKVAGRVAKK